MLALSAPTAPQTGSARRCIWCAADLDEVGERRAGRTLCRRCGVATTEPWPTDAELDHAYRGWYRPDNGRFGRLGDAFLRRSRARLAKRLDRLAPPGPVLDVGAGDGVLLDALRRAGREAVGLERESQRTDVREDDVTEVDGTWAAVVFWHSLEHLRNPREALAHAAGLLAAGGVLVVAVPNAGSWQARLFGDRWFALDLPRHLAHLPAPALVAELERWGAPATRVSYLRGGQVLFGWVHGLVGLLPGHPDLYQAIRRPEARSVRLGRGERWLALLAGVLLAPVAVAGATAEVCARRGGTVYIEARHGH